MGILHPGITQSSLVLRSEKTTRLSILESDGNLVYLEDLLLGLSQSVVPTGGTGGQVLAKVSGTDYALEWVDQTGGTGGTGNGTNGTSGTSGLNGTSGVDGTDGTNGTSGTSGVNGATGANGTSGTSGVDGATGADGTSGVDGATGADGTSGTSGVDGATGADGTSGVDGAAGADGTNGTSGTSGVDGATGASGTNGTSGTSGERGAVGSTFNILGIFPNYNALTQTVGTMSSITPPNNFDSYILIDTSHVWVYGPTASMGLTPSVANSDGWVDMGAIEGPQGLPGLNGTSGVNGADGANGTSGVNGADGTSGINGTDGTNGTSGVNGADGTSGTSGLSANLKMINNTYQYTLAPIALFDITNPTYSKTAYWDRAELGQDYLNINTVGSFGYVTYSNTTEPLSDNSSYEIPFYDITGAYVEFLGLTYSSFWVNSNSYITFGTSSTSSIISPYGVGAPAIFIGAGDNSMNKLIYGYDDPTVSGVGLTAHSGTEDIFRVRYLGNNDSNGSSSINPLGSTNSLQWEIQIQKSNPTVIGLIVEAAPASALTYRTAGGLWGISDSNFWVEKFSGLPTYDENFDISANAIGIISLTESNVLYASNIDSIKFIGPGVYKYSPNSTTSIIDIDPLGQYGIGINYDTYQSAATAKASVIAATKYDLRLTTGKDGSAVRIKPRGKAIINPYNRTPNQPGAGFNVEITASNAAASPTQSSYGGGDIVLLPGLGIGTGLTGSIYMGLPTSNSFLSGSTFLESVYIYDFDLGVDVKGWTGTYATGDGRVVTVVSGIITDVS